MHLHLLSYFCAFLMLAAASEREQRHILAMGQHLWRVHQPVCDEVQKHVRQSPAFISSGMVFSAPTASPIICSNPSSSVSALPAAVHHASIACAATNFSITCKQRPKRRCSSPLNRCYRCETSMKSCHSPCSNDLLTQLESPSPQLLLQPWQRLYFYDFDKESVRQLEKERVWTSSLSFMLEVYLKSAPIVVMRPSGSL